MVAPDSARNITDGDRLRFVPDQIATMPKASPRQLEEAAIDLDPLVLTPERVQVFAGGTNGQGTIRQQSERLEQAVGQPATDRMELNKLASAIKA
jgi:hypothetical protein